MLFLLALACSVPAPVAAPATPSEAVPQAPLSKIDSFKQGVVGAEKLTIEDATAWWIDIDEQYNAAYGHPPDDLKVIAQMIIENGGCTCRIDRQGMVQGWGGMYGSAFITRWSGCTVVEQIDGEWWIATTKPLDSEDDSPPGRCEALYRNSSTAIEE